MLNINFISCFTAMLLKMICVKFLFLNLASYGSKFGFKFWIEFYFQFSLDFVFKIWIQILVSKLFSNIARCGIEFWFQIWFQILHHLVSNFGFYFGDKFCFLNIGFKIGIIQHQILLLNLVLKLLSFSIHFHILSKFIFKFSY